MVVLQQQYLPNSGENIACCRHDWPDLAIFTHLCSTTSPHCNNPLYLLHSLFLSFTQNLLTALSLNCRRRTPPLRQLRLFAVEIYAFYTFFSRSLFNAGHYFPSMAAIHPPKPVFSPPSAGMMSAKYTHLATPLQFFLSFTQHFFYFSFPKEALCHQIV